MDKKEKRNAKSANSKTKFIAIGVGIAVVIAAGIGIALSMGGTTQNPNSETPSSSSRTVSWIHVHGLGVDPSDSRILYIATHGDFYESVDGGTPAKVDKQRADYMAFSAPQTAGVPLYASGHPSTGGNTGLIKSTDGGQTWQNVATVLDPPVDFHAMAVSKSDPNTIIGFDSGARGLFRTTDAGKTWEKLDYPADRYITALAISPSDPKVVFAGTDGGVFESRDGAASWTQLGQYRGITVLALAFDADENLYASTEEFGLGKSSDSGKTWESVNRPPNSLTVTSIAVDSPNKIIYVAGFAVPQGYQEVFKSASLEGEGWQLVGTNR
ncbi:MAG: F510_1955 family glycosylhydrolase [Nitrososphaera sp.]|uniref:F510_1955 family glycosylhydrolase n=1 Tax=Nitrososphaera sp. TaxID=1971748 RepID=UPI003D6DB85E